MASTEALLQGNKLSGRLQVFVFLRQIVEQVDRLPMVIRLLLLPEERWKFRQVADFGRAAACIDMAKMRRIKRDDVRGQTWIEAELRMVKGIQLST